MININENFELSSEINIKNINKIMQIINDRVGLNINEYNMEIYEERESELFYKTKNTNYGCIRLYKDDLTNEFIWDIKIRDNEGNGPIFKKIDNTYNLIIKKDKNFIKESWIIHANTIEESKTFLVEKINNKISSAITSLTKKQEKIRIPTDLMIIIGPTSMSYDINIPEKEIIYLLMLDYDSFKHPKIFEELFGSIDSYKIIKDMCKIQLNNNLIILESYSI